MSINADKTRKAAYIAKIWQLMRYQASTTNCGNCSNSRDSWVDDEDRGECKLIKGMNFPVLRHGICKRHSSLTQ